MGTAKEFCYNLQISFFQAIFVFLGYTGQLSPLRPAACGELVRVSCTFILVYLGPRPVQVQRKWPCYLMQRK